MYIADTDTVHYFRLNTVHSLSFGDDTWTLRPMVDAGPNGSLPQWDFIFSARSFDTCTLVIVTKSPFVPPRAHVFSIHDDTVSVLTHVLNPIQGISYGIGYGGSDSAGNAYFPSVIQTSDTAETEIGILILATCCSPD